MIEDTSLESKQQWVKRRINGLAPNQVKGE
ncbi:hypothetical protein Hgul01_01120 [Herpetosiphon gulosus]|uniref:Uncharacterized protein n=1 Tax=Herpetosiphon gulosus TaxID=1973496 RepID=A0ABP9WZ54_9CHLR